MFSTPDFKTVNALTATCPIVVTIFCICDFIPVHIARHEILNPFIFPVIAFRNAPTIPRTINFMLFQVFVKNPTSGEKIKDIFETKFENAVLILVTKLFTIVITNVTIDVHADVMTVIKVVKALDTAVVMDDHTDVTIETNPDQADEKNETTAETADEIQAVNPAQAVCTAVTMPCHAETVNDFICDQCVMINATSIPIGPVITARIVKPHVWKNETTALNAVESHPIIRGPKLEKNDPSEDRTPAPHDIKFDPSVLIDDHRLFTKFRNVSDF
jgi:hypothetical protein